MIISSMPWDNKSLCLLGLSVAFDTNDHNLITPLDLGLEFMAMS